jgi:limonene-1,2-epoxide hydrolase
MNGPIGKMGDFGEAMQWFLVFMTFGAYGPPIYNSMCFHRDTLIKTPKGSLSIAQLKTGDIIGSGSNRVLATISIGRCNAGVYRINGILVSGDHLMLCPDTMRWMRVADNELAEPVEYDDELYCLITHSGIIEVEGKTRTIIFRDYIDTHDGETLTNMRKFAIEWLNKKPEPNYRDHAEEYIWGMAISTPITINSAGDTRALGDIVAGDYIWCRGELRKVKARISCAPRACPAIKWNGITISANCCVDVYGTWTRVAKLIEEGCETFIDDEPLAHLIVEGGVIEVATNDKRLLVRDFIDINTPAYNNFIDKYVEARVNIV